MNPLIKFAVCLYNTFPRSSTIHVCNVVYSDYIKTVTTIVSYLLICAQCTLINTVLYFIICSIIVYSHIKRHCPFHCILSKVG